MRLFVTGATGYIGERLIRRARADGYEVIAATRHRPQDARIEWVPFDFAAYNELRLPPKVDVVIHLAAVTKHDIVNPETEIAAARHLIAAALQGGATFIFVSSQVARAAAPTPYGRTKWQIERIVLEAGGWAVRPGQVYGGPERGLFGVLVNAVRKLPVIPAFVPAPRIQPIHIDDLVDGLLRCCVSPPGAPRVLCLGSDTPVSFTDFLSAIARDRVGRVRLPLPVPVVLVRLVVTLLGANLSSRLGLDKLNSLFDLPTMQTGDDLAALGLTLRPLSSGMTKRGKHGRRRLIREGRALLTYVLKIEPAVALIKRYVRGIEDLRGGQAIGLPAWMQKRPATIALLDDRSTQATAKGQEFHWRLDAAIVLAEASVQGATRFLGLGGRSGFVIDGLRMAGAVFRVAAWRLLSLMIRCRLG
jgi:NADH dehydrogenase